MATYAAVDTANLRATHYAKRIFDGVNTGSDIENGTIGYLNGLSDDDVIYNFSVGYKAGESVGLVHNPEWNEDSYNSGHKADLRKDKYINEAGKPFRVFMLDIDDEFDISIEGFTSATRSVVTGVTDFTATAVYATIDSSTGKLVATTTAPTSVDVVFKIMRKRTSGATLATPLRNYGYSNVMYGVKVIKMP